MGCPVSRRGGIGDTRLASESYDPHSVALSDEGLLPVSPCSQKPPWVTLVFCDTTLDIAYRPEHPLSARLILYKSYPLNSHRCTVHFDEVSIPGGKGGGHREARAPLDTEVPDWVLHVVAALVIAFAVPHPA
jgi:hypothetical protein